MHILGIQAKICGKQFLNCGTGDFSPSKLRIKILVVMLWVHFF